MSDQHPYEGTYEDPYHESVPPEQDRSGRHPVNVGHLVMGIAFLGLTLVWALFASDTIQGEDLRWFLPVPWLAAGLAGLLAVVWGQRRGHREW